MKKRKVAFYSIRFQEQNNNIDEVKTSLSNLLSYINGLAPIDRKIDLSLEKFCFMDKMKVFDSGEYTRILFKSAKHSYRAPLLDRETIDERENPKRMTEGEQMKTHAVIKFLHNDVIMFLEQGSNCMSSNNIAFYLNQLTNQYNEDCIESAIHGTFVAQQILKEDFFDQLQSMDRVIKAEIVTDKKILGSEFLNFTQRMTSLKEEVKINISAQRGLSLKDAIIDAWYRFTAGATEIARIRVEGVGEHKEKTIINTDQFAKIEYVEANQNEDTGEFDSLDMFNRMMLVAQRYV